MKRDDGAGNVGVSKASSGISRREAIRRGLVATGGLVLADGLVLRGLGAGTPAKANPQLPDEFPSSLRRKSPVTDLNQAVVFTINETTNSDYAVDLCRRTGSDVLIRCWFKWGKAPPVQRWREYPVRVHALGAVFGGGITCSALMDGENGISRAQLLDMATRGPDGQLVDAWGHPGIRHGSLSSPAYLDYLFRWCREQMDAGVDYLFMDENTAALRPNEGYDDHSLNDFRFYLLEHFPQTRGWAVNDARWENRFKIELTDPQICPDGDMRSFSYRAYLRKHELLKKPQVRQNRLAPAWRRFRVWRDDRAWKSLTDRIRAYAASKGRRVFISANGLVRYVDLQVLGVWYRWRVKDGQVDLGRSQLSVWRKLVVEGHALAGKRVPVVLFQDWGMGTPPFRWLAVSPEQRKLWMRTRGAEIYAAGGFFAFPVLGPFGCDAGRDGTLGTIERQTRFYQTHRQLFSEGRFLGSKSVRSSVPNLSLAAWTTGRPGELAIHVINRNVRDGEIRRCLNVVVDLPLASAPASAQAISPDWAGEKPVTCEAADGRLKVTLKELEAYAVVWLRYGGQIDTSALKDES